MLRVLFPNGSRGLDRILKRYSISRVAKFAVAAGIGFLISEVILFLGALGLYHAIAVPGLVNTSLAILGLDALALGTGSTVAFVINERVTVPAEESGRGGREGRRNWLTRWNKYQLAALSGNCIIAGVQLLLLITLSLFPAYGSIVGAIVSYPVTYAISMRFVWGIAPFK